MKPAPYSVTRDAHLIELLPNFSSVSQQRFKIEKLFILGKIFCFFFPLKKEKITSTDFTDKK